MTTSLPVPDTTLHKRARAARARSMVADRTFAIVAGLVVLAAGVLVALLGYGFFGAGRASRPLLDPVVVDTLRAQPLLWRLVAIGGGLLIGLLGLWWAGRSLRPERKPDVRLAGAGSGGSTTTIVVDSTAAADAVAAQAATLPGVGSARARMVGHEGEPALRITLWLEDDADVRTVLDRLHGEVLADARSSLDLGAIPAAVRLELEAAAPSRPRVT